MGSCRYLGLCYGCFGGSVVFCWVFFCVGVGILFRFLVRRVWIVRCDVVCDF